MKRFSWLIVYNGENGETIVTTSENEPNTVREYFTNGGRDIEEYSRYVNKDGHISITSELDVR